MSDYRNGNGGVREILGRRAKPEKKLHQSRRRGCVLWYDDLSLDRGLEDKEERRCRTEVGYDIFSMPEYKRHFRRPRQNQTQLHPRLHPARLTPLHLPCLELDHCYTVGNQRQRFQGTPGLTSLCSLLVHDTVSAFPAANGLARLDVIFGATIFRTLSTYNNIRDMMLLTGTQVLHLLPRRR
jgi:hypothetical protein